MKKNTILGIVSVLLALLFVFTACGNNATATTVKNRWNETETGSYTISLSDFADGTETNGGVFKSYVNESDNVAYYKDRLMSAEVAFTARDEIMPVKLQGKFTYKIQNGVSDCTFTTEQVVYAVYNAADVQNVQDLQHAKATDEEVTEQFGEVSANVVVLKSVLKTTVTFSTTESANKKRNYVPLSSSSEVDGFYIGKTHQGLSATKVSTVYDLEKGTAKVTKDGTEVVREISVPGSGNFIDANQLWLYSRSLEKHRDNFNDAPTVTVYDPVSDTAVTAEYRFTYESPTVISHKLADGTEKQYYVKLSSLAVYLGGGAYMFTQSYPDKLAELKELDCITTGFGAISKYTVSRFRVGYMSYQLDDQPTSLLSDLEDVSTKK